MPFLVGRFAATVADTIRDLRGGGRGWTLLFLACGWFFVLGLRFVVPALLPAITEDFPVSDTTAGAAITLLWVAYALMQFPAGALIDRLGERRLLAASAVVSATGLAGYALSPTFGLFLAATAAFGLGSGLYGPPRGTVLSRTFPDRDGAAFGAVLAAGSLGAAILPAAATLATDAIGWRLAIGATLPGFAVVAVGIWRSVPRHGSTPPATDGGRPTGRAKASAVGRAVRSRKVVLAAVGATLMLFVFQGVTAFFTTYLVEEKTLTEGTAGVLFGLLFVVGAVSQSTCGALADRYGHGTVLTAVCLVGIVPLLALPVVSGVGPLALAAALLGVRLSVGPVTNSYIVSLLPPAVRGTSWGFLRTMLFVVGAFGSTGVGAMADADLFAEAFLLLAGMTAVAGVIFYYLPDREQSGA